VGEGFISKGVRPAFWVALKGEKDQSGGNQSNVTKGNNEIQEKTREKRVGKARAMYNGK